MFTTQAQIDQFQSDYPGCTQIEGDARIGFNDITNLEGLSVLTSLGGGLQIGQNDFLTDLFGLRNLTSIGGTLWINNCNALTNLTGLEGLTSIRERFGIIDNASLTSLMGLNNVTSVGAGQINISGNSSLINLTGLEGISSIGGSLIIGDDESGGNDALTSLTGLDNLTSIGEFFWLQYNDSLADFTGLDNLTSIGGSLDIRNNSSLVSLSGIDQLTSIGGSLNLLLNWTLEDITSLANLNSIGGDLNIIWNSLTSLSGLDNIEASSISNLTLSFNTSLSICEIESICDYLAAPNGTVNISNNSTGCNSRAEVETACESISVDDHLVGQWASVYPNPSEGIFIVDITLENDCHVKVEIYNEFNEKIDMILDEYFSQGTHRIIWNSEGFPSGVYFYKITDGYHFATGKMLKIR